MHMYCILRNALHTICNDVRMYVYDTAGWGIDFTIASKPCKLRIINYPSSKQITRILIKKNLHYRFRSITVSFVINAFHIIGFPSKCLFNYKEKCSQYSAIIYKYIRNIHYKCQIIKKLNYKRFVPPVVEYISIQFFMAKTKCNKVIVRTTYFTYKSDLGFCFCLIETLSVLSM